MGVVWLVGGAYIYSMGTATKVSDAMPFATFTFT